MKDRLVLKGGTALNLFFFDLPRLSVDIDMNYIGKLDRQEMLLDRPEVDKALEAVFQREGLSIRRVPEKHAGGKWQLRYTSALGGTGNLEVDLNFMFRTHLYGIHKQALFTFSVKSPGIRQAESLPYKYNPQKITMIEKFPDHVNKAEKGTPALLS